MGSIDWQNIRVKLGDLKPWSDNPRCSTKAQAERILKSFDEFGQVETIAVSPALDVYNGHQRLSALVTLHGADYEVDARQCSRLLTDEERKRLTVYLHAGAVGSWDWDTISSWDAPELIAWGMDDPVLRDWKRDVTALDALLKSEQADPVDAEEEIETTDRFEEVLNKWQVEDGQTWRVGSHLIHCGDCLAEYPTSFVVPNIIIADPPYGVNIVATNGYVGGGEAYNIPFGGRKGNVGGTASHMAKTGMTYMESNKRKGFGSVGASKPFGSKAVRGTDGASHIVEVGKYPVIIGDENTDVAKLAYIKFSELFPDAIQVWWGANYYTDAPLPPSQCWLVWNKETTGNFADCELAFTNLNKAARLFTHQWNGMLRDSEREKRWHPTQKPAALVSWILDSFSGNRDILFDPFGGAGWTMIGAQMTGRIAQVIEKLPAYCAVILERMSTAFPELEISRVTGN